MRTWALRDLEGWRVKGTRGQGTGQASVSGLGSHCYYHMHGRRCTPRQTLGLSGSLLQTRRGGAQQTRVEREEEWRVDRRVERVLGVDPNKWMKGCGPLAPRSSGWVCSPGAVLESPPEVPLAGAHGGVGRRPQPSLTAKPQRQPQAGSCGRGPPGRGLSGLLRGRGRDGCVVHGGL